MKDVVIVGAGLAGLECARLLEDAKAQVTLLEASDAPGGRVRTDLVDGFRLDRGFQVLITAYPDAKRALDYPALSLKSFLPGALVWHGGSFHRFADPFREPIAALGLLFDPVIPLLDKIGVARLRRYLARCTNSEYFEHPERTTRAFLRDFGFSDIIIERFFRPFFGGVFLETDLITSSRLFEFLFRMFSTGSACVPALGMEEIPRQMASRLSAGALVTKARVTSLKRSRGIFILEVEGMAPVEARVVVLATEEHEARKLLGQAVKGKKQGAPRQWNSTTTIYYAADQAPVDEPILMLNGEGPEAGPVNHASLMTAVSPGHAPRGEHLIAVNVVGEAPQADAGMAGLEQRVRTHIEKWFGPQVKSWRVVGGYPIRYALPLQRAAEWEKSDPATRVGAVTDPGARVFLCGDYRETASLQGALASGRRVAEAVIPELKT
jgi:phytoene dehydrogenase-like protein